MVILMCKLHVSSTVAINPFSILFTTTTTITIKSPITSAAMHGDIKPNFHIAIMPYPHHKPIFHAYVCHTHTVNGFKTLSHHVQYCSNQRHLPGQEQPKDHYRVNVFPRISIHYHCWK